MPDEDPFGQFTADFVQEKDPFSEFTSDFVSEPKTSAAGAATRSVARGVLPALGAAAGGALGYAAGVALAPATGGLSMALPLAGTFIGGLGGALGTKKAQDVALETISPEAAALEAADIAQHPAASLGGRLAANLPVFAFAPGQTLRGLASIPSVVRGTATEAQKQAAGVAALQTGLGTAGGVVAPLVQGESPTLAGVGEAALQSALFGQPRLKALVPRALRAAQETPQPKATDAIQGIGKAGEVLRDVPEQPVKGTQQVPSEVSPERVPQGELPQAKATEGEISLATEQRKQAEAVGAKELEESAQIQQAESAAMLGITPPGARVFGQVVDAFTPKVQGTLPKTPTTAGDWLPDLGDATANKAIATEPTGIGRIPILNWLFDPRHRAKTEPEKSILNYFYEQAVGQANVKALGSTFGTRFKQLFPRNEAGEFTTVGRVAENQSLHPSDVFEALQQNPDSYRLTPQQRNAFDELMRYERRARELEQQYGIRESPESGEFEPGGRGDTPYYTRGRVVGQPKRPRGMAGPGGAMVGGRQFFQKARAFESERQGVRTGFSYPMNVDDRILIRLSRLYKAIGDRRLAQDEGLGGRWGSDTGPITYQEAQVFQPAFRSGAEYKIFPVEVAQKINASLGAQQTAWLKALVSVNDFFKAITLGFDYGAGQIQGIITAFRDPKAWANANATALRAFANKDAFAAYMRNNAQAAQELAQFGSGVGSIPEMVTGLSEGGVVSAVPRAIGKSFEEIGFPRVGKAIRSTEEVPQAFGRVFQTFLDVAKIEKWKARREVIPREEWPRAIQDIEHELNMGRMEAIGVGPGQALAERLLLLAPSYYRGGLGLIGDMSAAGVTGAQAQRAMGSYMAGIIATFAAGAMAAGLPWEEIKRRLNPSGGNFMMIPVKLGEKSIEVGFGGIMRSFMRLAGEVMQTSIEHPENWKSLASDKNPFSKWLRGHSAPVISKAWDQFSGEDYAGEDTDMSSLAKGSLPLALQAWLKQEPGQTGAQTAADVVFSFAGLLSWPQSTRNKMLVERNKLATAKFGAPYENLKIRQQAVVTRALERNPEFALKEPATPRVIEQAFRNQVERQTQVQAGLEKSIRDVLEEQGLHVPGFEPTMKVGPTQIYLTDVQMERYKSLIIDEYNRVLKGRAQLLRRSSPQRGQDLINDWTAEAKARARTKLRLEFNR